MRPSGEYYVLTGVLQSEPVEVTIAQVAAALVGFTVGGIDIIQRYPSEAIPSLGAGIVMVPWPNRIDGGQWPYEGRMLQLDITEVKHNNAIHGLLRTTAYELVERSEHSLTLTATIYAPNGYPFVVQTWVTYTLTPTGLEVTHRLHNHSEQSAPVAVGTHAYFRIGDVPTSDLVLRSSAQSVYVDSERYLPVRREGVSGERDLGSGARVGELALDNCFTDLELVDGRTVTDLTAPDGRSVTVWTDAAFAYQVLLTTSEFVGESGEPVLAVAIEPQTAAVNAFNSGDGLHHLAPGDDWVVSWGVTANLRG